MSNTNNNDKGRIAVPPLAWREAVEIIVASRAALHRWGARYAGSDHAQKDKQHTNLLVERIDDWLLRNAK